MYYKKFFVGGSFSFPLCPKTRQLVWMTFHAFRTLGFDVMILFFLFSFLHILFLRLEGEHQR
jgi:hypothetical protein